MKKHPEFIVHGEYIGRLVRIENGFPIYRFPGGDCVGGEEGFDTREAAEKHIEYYANGKAAQLASEMCNAIKKLASDPDHLSNFESYLAHTFPEWLEKFANTPEGLANEFTEFANMKF